MFEPTVASSFSTLPLPLPKLTNTWFSSYYRLVISHYVPYIFSRPAAVLIYLLHQAENRLKVAFGDWIMAISKCGKALDTRTSNTTEIDASLVWACDLKVEPSLQSCRIIECGDCE